MSCRILCSYKFSRRWFRGWFKSLSKTEFKEYVGNLKYAEYRCEEIYKRLEEIEREVCNL